MFKLDSKFMTLCSKFANLFILNILTVTFCIPIITIGPALSALHYTAFRLSTDTENSVLRDFLHGFRINFRQGFILGLFSLLGIAIIGLDAFLMVSGLVDPAEAAVKTFHISAMVLLSFFILSIVTWSFILLSRYNDRIGRILKNAVYVSLGNLGRTIPIVLLSVLPFAMVLINWALASIVLLCGFSVSAYLQAKLYKKVFARLEAVSGTDPETMEA